MKDAFCRSSEEPLRLDDLSKLGQFALSKLAKHRRLAPLKLACGWLRASGLMDGGTMPRRMDAMIVQSVLGALVTRGLVASEWSERPRTYQITERGIALLDGKEIPHRRDHFLGVLLSAEAPDGIIRSHSGERDFVDS